MRMITVGIKSWKIGKKTQKITKIKLFINRYNWKGKNYSSGKEDWKNFEKNNPKIALNAMFV